MNMKKKMAPLLTAALVAANVVPVLAVDTSGGNVNDKQDITDTQQTVNTTVVANVSKIDPGDVTYTVSVPSYVDFGEVQRNGEGEYNKVLSGEVKLTEVNGLDAENNRIAVLVQDTKNGMEGFRIYGETGKAYSNGQYLGYNILANSQNLLASTKYSNGFLIGAFMNAEDAVNLEFKLDQNQITGELDNWEGSYKGTLTFYSKVVDKAEYN
ncbi:MAG: hypothetical protein Q4C91_13275 [Eubacteriales bacterium]|nr:hypothetical protein [Eubacteriales bacterium]